jgi:hypothetical protein
VAADDRELIRRRRSAPDTHDEQVRGCDGLEIGEAMLRIPIAPSAIATSNCDWRNRLANAGSVRSSEYDCPAMSTTSFGRRVSATGNAADDEETCDEDSESPVQNHFFFRR